MALSKEFDPKNGFMGGINIKPMGVNNITPTKVETPKIDPITKKEGKTEQKNENKRNDKSTLKIKEENKAVTVNKGGRPKKYDVEKIRTTLFFPEDLLDEMDIATTQFRGSRTDYIISLVKKDLEENKLQYEQLRKILKK